MNNESILAAKGATPPILPAADEDNEAAMRRALINKMCQAAILLHHERIAATMRQAGG